MNKESVQGNIDYFRQKMSQTIDTAIEFARMNFVDSARTYFEVALSYKVHLKEFEDELREIERQEEIDFKKRLKEELKRDLEEDLI